MGILEAIGELSIFHVLIPLIFIAILIYKLKRGRKPMKEHKKNIVQNQSEVVEPATVESLGIRPKPVIQRPQPSYPEGEVIIWDRIFMILIVVALFISSLGFVWGIANNKFKSISNVDADFPEIDFPEINFSDMPSHSCNCTCSPCICPNVSVESPIVNVYYNITNSSV